MNTARDAHHRRAVATPINKNAVILTAQIIDFLWPDRTHLSEVLPMTRFNEGLYRTDLTFRLSSLEHPNRGVEMDAQMYCTQKAFDPQGSDIITLVIRESEGCVVRSLVTPTLNTSIRIRIHPTHADGSRHVERDLNSVAPLIGVDLFVENFAS